ncbi:hypothetical protein Nhal_0263 [Nitrosococcus halophilus Nc 4]|uniref:Uncharacterized protein n=1 Tax=Nitrosococcus halophilus (strain Nc4) TaxID=472759 RepID=D5BUR4_NITHN|nr:hypothetical protein Nhal_0263 [Nitrosococcus halophilus Nc 4]
MAKEAEQENEPNNNIFYNPVFDRWRCAPLAST